MVDLVSVQWNRCDDDVVLRRIERSHVRREKEPAPSDVEDTARLVERGVERKAALIVVVAVQYCRWCRFYSPDLSAVI